MANTELEINQSDKRRITPDTVRWAGKDVYVFKPPFAEIPSVPGNINYKDLFKIYETSDQGVSVWRSLFPDVTENPAQLRKAIIPEVKINEERAVALRERDWYDIHVPIPPSMAEKGDSPLKLAAALYPGDVAVEAVIHQKLPPEAVGFVLARNTDPLYEQEMLLHQQHLGEEGLKRALAIRDSLRQSRWPELSAIVPQEALTVNV